MSRPGGPYDNHADQPPGGWTHTDQLAWLNRDEDPLLEDFYEHYQFTNVFDGEGAHRGGTRAPVDTRPSDRSHVCMSSPSDESRPMAQLLPDVSGPVTHDRAA